MSQKYQGKAQDKRYTGEAIDVTFNLKRCIHAQECGKGLVSVFNTNQRPWVQADNASADEVTTVVQRCPSGALHFERKDGGAEETAVSENVIHVHTKGYYRIQGDLNITSSNVDIEGETRATLCRCGASKNKPFCDNAHKEIEFEAPTEVTKPHKEGLTTGGQLRVHLYENGPIELEGNYIIKTDEGDTIFQSEGKKTWLCRCGQSGAKPFCDQTHKQIGFEAP